MDKVTYLGPYGSTFTHEAYRALAQRHRAPLATPDNYVPAGHNSEVLESLESHGGYAALAVETLAECRVNESLESFVRLLERYPSTDEVPFHIVGGMARPLHFCLMAREDVSRAEVTAVLAHEKTFAVCKRSIAQLNIGTHEVASNGKAALLVASSAEYATAAALGPRAAAAQYGLRVLDEAFEDEKAVTTFVLLAPRSHSGRVGKRNRGMFIFRVPHEPGALVRVQEPLARAEINMTSIHSVGTGRGTYSFVTEVELTRGQCSDFAVVEDRIRRKTVQLISFSPFEVIDPAT